MAWIRRQQHTLQEQGRQSQREMVTGESHFVQGRRYRLEVIEQDAPSAVVLRSGRTLELRVRPGSDEQKRRNVLQGWYWQLLRDQIPDLLAKWEPVIGVEVAHCGIRRMKTRWGDLQHRGSADLAEPGAGQDPPICLEYILVHEMVHFLERHHNDRFRAYMDQFLPQWRTARAELNRAPLAHENWEY